LPQLNASVDAVTTAIRKRSAKTRTPDLQRAIEQIE
jgi:hypothetical protein